MEPQLGRVEAPFFLVQRMSGELAISIGQYSDKGRKDTNQDFHGALIPEQPLLGLKGIAIVLATESAPAMSAELQASWRSKAF